MQQSKISKTVISFYVYVTGNVCNQGFHVNPGDFTEYVKSLISLGIT